MAFPFQQDLLASTNDGVQRKPFVPKVVLCFRNTSVLILSDYQKKVICSDLLLLDLRFFQHWALEGSKRLVLGMECSVGIRYTFTDYGKKHNGEGRHGCFRAGEIDEESILACPDTNESPLSHSIHLLPT